MEATCARHPIKKAAAKCRKCGMPLCWECRLQAIDGTIYCSTQCREDFARLKETLAESPGTSRRSGKFSLVGTLRTLAISAVLVAVIWAAMGFWLKSFSPRDWLPALRQMLKVL